MADDSEKYAAPALDKGLDIIELLSLSADALSMGQIAEQMGRSKGEIFRMLVALERRGYIRRNPDSDRFEIGNRLFELAMRVPPTRNLVAMAMSHIETAANELDQSCHLAVLSGSQIVVIARVEAPGEMGFSVRLGYRRRIDHSTSGTVLAAFASPAGRQAIFDRLSADYADFDAKAFAALLDETRAKGHEQGPSVWVAGVTDVGAPVFGETGWAVAALTVPYIQRAGSSSTVEHATDVLLREARLLSTELAVGLPVQPEAQAVP